MSSFVFNPSPTQQGFGTGIDATPINCNNCSKKANILCNECFPKPYYCNLCFKRTHKSKKHSHHVMTPTTSTPQTPPKNFFENNKYTQSPPQTNDQQQNPFSSPSKQQVACEKCGEPSTLRCFECRVSLCDKCCHITHKEDRMTKHLIVHHKLQATEINSLMLRKNEDDEDTFHMLPEALRGEHVAFEQFNL
jgi:hypothetical protein